MFDIFTAEITRDGRTKAGDRCGNIGCRKLRRGHPVEANPEAATVAASRLRRFMPISPSKACFQWRRGSAHTVVDKDSRGKSPQKP